MAFVKRQPKIKWRGSLTSEEEAVISDIETRRKVLESSLRKLNSDLRLIRDRAMKRAVAAKQRKLAA